MNRESTPDTIERELKLGLRDCDPISVSSALRDLLGREPTGTTRLLVNRYYDLSGQLHKAGVAIRTRSINDQHEMTVKISKKGKGSGIAQGDRRYKSKQKGFGGQTKPIFRKKAKTTKKVTLKLECTKCKIRRCKVIGRCKSFVLGKKEKTKGMVLF